MSMMLMLRMVMLRMLTIRMVMMLMLRMVMMLRLRMVMMLRLRMVMPMMVIAHSHLCLEPNHPQGNAGHTWCNQPQIRSYI